MAQKPVRHVNLVDDSGQVYCHAVGEIVALEGPHIATKCWGCDYWTGLAGGYGVECTYEDGNLGKGVLEMTYRNAEDAKDHAPEGSVGDATPDKDAAKAAELRLKIHPDPEKVADEIKNMKKEEANTDTEVAQQSAEDASVTDAVIPPTDMGDASVSADVVTMKKATVADVLGAMFAPKVLGETKHLPGKHDQASHAGGDATALGGGIPEKLAGYFLGSGAKKIGDDTYEWSKRGGHPDAKLRSIHKKLEENGFTFGSGSQRSSQADEGSVGSENIWSHPDGFQVKINSFYGGTADSNRFSVVFSRTSRGASAGFHSKRVTRPVAGSYD